MSKLPSSGATDGATAADCDALATSTCAKLATCNPFAGELIGSACVERHASFCKARITAPSTGYTHSALLACAQAMDTSTCDAAVFAAEPLPACVLKGGMALDASCALDEQCASGNCSATLTSCGKCVPAKPPSSVPPQANAGEACDDARTSAPRCNGGKGLWCNAATNKCAPVSFVANGEPCGTLAASFATCTAGSRCNYGPTGGVCVAETAVGAPCSTQLECPLMTACLAGKCSYVSAAAICN